MTAELPQFSRRALASRRSLLAGTATGLIAGAGTMAAVGLARPQSAEAATGTTPDWINITAAPYNADPSGATDSTAAIQAALNQVAATGGAIYIPTGNYTISSGLTYSSSLPLMITGDGPQASNIRMASASAEITYLSISQTFGFGDWHGSNGTVTIENIAFYNYQAAGAYSDTNVALELSAVNFGQIRNVGFYLGPTPTFSKPAQGINQAIVLSSCSQVDIDNATIVAAVNGIAVTGSQAQSSQVTNISNVSIWTHAGTGVATAAAVLYQGNVLTANMENAIFHDGDRGILWTQDSGANVPHLLFCYNAQPNNHSIAAMEFDYGAQVYLTECFFSGNAADYDVAAPGILFGSNFQGSAKVEGCQFNGIPGHTISVQNGTGFFITGCEFGSNGKPYKYASNTYDEINIGASAGDITIDSCHFNVDALAGIGQSNLPRSALYVASSATDVTISNSKGLAAGTNYGTAPIVDLGYVVMRRGNIGLGLADQRTSGGLTLTGESVANLSGTLTIPAYDMTVGTVYRFTAFGHGTQPSAPVTLYPKLNIGGASLGTFATASMPPAGQDFYWTYTCNLFVTGWGSTGTIVSNETFTWGGITSTSTTAPSPWNGLTSAHGNSSFTVNTLQANAVYMSASWASTGATITCDCTMLERVQNYPAS